MEILRGLKERKYPLLTSFVVVHPVRQDLSVAGKRAGLSGERSGLFMEQIRVIKEMRNASGNCGTDDDIRPCRFTIWENVPGALSSGDPRGEDFRIVLEETCRVKDENAVVPRPSDGRWATCGVIMGVNYSVAWRLHDAQYFGVPQRRRRLCVLADYEGHAAPRLLFDIELRGSADTPDQDAAYGHLGDQPGPEVQPVGEGVSGHSEQSGETGEGSPRSATGSADGASESAYTLKIRGGAR